MICRGSERLHVRLPQRVAKMPQRQKLSLEVLEKEKSYAERVSERLEVDKMDTAKLQLEGSFAYFLFNFCEAELDIHSSPVF